MGMAGAGVNFIKFSISIGSILDKLNVFQILKSDGNKFGRWRFAALRATWRYVVWSKGRRHMREIVPWKCCQTGLEHDLWLSETSYHQEVYREKKIYCNFSFHFLLFCIYLMFFCFVVYPTVFLFCILCYIFCFVYYLIFCLFFFLCLGVSQGQLVYPTHQAKHSLPLMCGSTICSLQAL